MKITIDPKDLVRKIERELEDIQSFRCNIMDHMTTMLEADDEDHILSLAKGIAFNKRLENITFVRISAWLELVGFYDEGNEIITVDVIEEKLDQLRMIANADDTKANERTDST